MTHVLLMSSLQLGSTAIGLKTKHGVVLVVEKRVTSPLLVSPLDLLLFSSW
jgi:20S proteasome alpha/beta subunit